MADNQVTIDTATLLDDVDAQQVEFDGEASDETYRFAVQYDVLEALSGDRPEDDAVAMVQQFVDIIASAAASALARDADQEIVVISENDLD